VEAIGSDINLMRRSREAISDVIAQRTEALVKGFPADFPNYRERVGEIEGLRTALGLMEEIARKMLNTEPEK
jgi:hypothetical protein